MRKRLFDLAEELQASMHDERLGQELLVVAEYGRNEDIEALTRILGRWKA